MPCLSTGINAEYAFNEYGQEQLEDAFLSYFGDDDWYPGRCRPSTRRWRPMSMLPQAACS